MLESTEAKDVVIDGMKSHRILTMVKENRVEAMIITILLYSTGLLEKAFTYGTGVCA